MIIISFLAAIPLAYYFMNEWLTHYSYRADMSWWIFAAAGMGALLVTLITVSFQTMKAALSNPIRNLRTE